MDLLTAAGSDMGGDSSGGGTDWASIVGGIEGTVVGTVSALNQPTIAYVPAPGTVGGLAPGTGLLGAGNNNTLLLLGLIVVVVLLVRKK